MSIKILNEGFEKIFSSVKQNKELKEAYDPALKELSSVLLDLSKRIKNGKINCNLKSCADAFQNIIENMYPDKSWWEVTDVNIQNDLFDTQDPEKTALNIIKNIREKSDRKIESLKKSEMAESKQRRTKKPIKESLRRKRLKESEKEPTIKRYSDVRPYSERKYWYFTTHGVQPGSIPRDLNVLEIRDGQNDRGTWGTYVMLDGVLNTSELKKYDMRELVPPMHESKKRRIHERNLTRSERHNRDMEKIFSTKKAQDKKFADFLRKNGYSEEQVDKLQKQDKLSAEIAKKFTPKGKQPSDVLGKILGESRKQKCRLKESFEEPVYSMPVSIKVRNGYLETDVSIWEDGDEYALDIGEENPVETPNKEKITSDWIQNKIPYVSWDWYDSDLDYMKHQCKKAVNAIENFFEENPLKESLKRKNKKSLKESKKLNESFDDMEVFMNTWANYNENGADSGITPTGWMSIDDAIEYCEEYADYEPFINDTDNVPFDDINEYSNASSVLQELKELQESDVDEDVVAAIVEATGYSVKEAIEIAERGDYYWYPGLSDYTDLAYAIVDELGGIGEAVGKNVVNYIDEDQMRREYRWDIREIMRDTAEQEVDDAHEGEDEDSYDREQEIEDWMDEHEDEYLDMIIDEEIEAAERGEADLSNYFDYEAFGRDLSFDGYTITDKGIILVN